MLTLSLIHIYHGTGEQIDRDALDAVELAHGAVHVRLAGGACHATHVELILKMCIRDRFRGYLSS